VLRAGECGAADSPAPALGDVVENFGRLALAADDDLDRVLAALAGAREDVKALGSIANATDGFDDARV